MDGGAAPQAPALSPAVLSPAVQGLVASIGAVRAQVPAELPGPLALVEAAALLRELQVLQAVVLARLADVDTRQLHALDDAASTAGWVQRQGTGYDRGQVALARKVSRMPAVAAEVLAGRLTVGQALQIGRSLDGVRPHLDRPDGLIDGQDGEQVLLGVIAHGVPALVGPAHGGLADDDPMLVALLDQSSRLATDPALTQAVRLEQAFVLLARHVQPEALAPALGMLVDAVCPSSTTSGPGAATSSAACAWSAQPMASASAGATWTWRPGSSCSPSWPRHRPPTPTTPPTRRPGPTRSRSPDRDPAAGCSVTTTPCSSRSACCWTPRPSASAARPPRTSTSRSPCPRCTVGPAPCPA